MMIKKQNITYTDFEQEAIVNTRMRLISKLLLHREASRKQLAEELEVSVPTVTNHTQDLLNHGYLAAATIPLAGVKRPVQLLSLAPGEVLCAAVELSSTGVEVELSALDGKLREARYFKAGAQQREILAALRQAADFLRNFNELESAVIGVDGLVGPDQKVVFSIRGLEDWDACSPAVLAGLDRVLPHYIMNSTIMAKARGLVNLIRKDRHVGIFERRGNDFHIGAVYNECINLGHLGTSGSYVHVETAGGAPCYCGLERCFYAAVRSGRCDAGLLAEGIGKMTESTALEFFGLDFDSEPLARDTNRILEQGGRKGVVISDGTGLCRQGLRMMAAESAWRCILKRFFQTHTKDHRYAN